MKNIISWFLIITVIIWVIWFFWAQETLAPEVSDTPAEVMEKLPADMAADTAQMIEVNLVPNTQITSPMTLTGRAFGPWYFEASFPIELRDSNNTLLATAIAQAQGDWMTENWVPFTAPLSFPAQPSGSTGTLVLKKDNPSGEPQNDASLVVPVQF